MAAATNRGDLYGDDLPLAAGLKEAHGHALEQMVNPGPFWRGHERRAMVLAARAATGCGLCARRSEALSPGQATGNHDGPADLPPILVDAIHRIRTDPGRLTRRWFDAVSAETGQGPYVEMVSVVCTSVIIDTLHRALGLALPDLPPAASGEPTGAPAADVVDAGAWLPITRAPDTMADTGLPMVPNIVRAMGLVPAAVELFFGAFRPHYALKDIALSLSQSQAEFVASRVSAMNECFY